MWDLQNYSYIYLEDGIHGQKTNEMSLKNVQIRMKNKQNIVLVWG